MREITMTVTEVVTEEKELTILVPDDATNEEAALAARDAFLDDGGDSQTVSVDERTFEIDGVDWSEDELAGSDVDACDYQWLEQPDHET
jgi:hypothetical protein